MTKISHYEVYADSGGGWQLLERFTMDQRSQAYRLAKENESASFKVKIIRETFELEDNTYSETVEYVSNLSKKKGTHKSLNRIDYQKSSSEVVQDIADSRRNIYKAIIKFIVLIVISLIFANIFVSLLFPILETFTDEKDNQTLMFFVFFIIFLAMAIPLVLKNIPWYIFLPQDKENDENITEEFFFDKAKSLVKAFNINGDPKTMVAGSYPEAPLEYKQYLVYYLSEILSNLNVRTALQKQNTRLGVKLLVFGGCLELARYGGLKLTEANSILFEAFRIIDGQDTNLEEFYEAKQSFSDNKVAIYLTGIGAYLMHQIISDQKLYIQVLNDAFDKWEALYASDNDKVSLPQEENQDPSAVGIRCRVNIKSDLKFLDTNLPDQDKIAANTSEAIRTITTNLTGKYAGFNMIEAGGITSVDFTTPQDAVKFASECLKEISLCMDDNNDEEKLILRTCCVIMPIEGDAVDDVYIKDLFEHVYNNEIVMVKKIADTVSDEEKDYLGDKALTNSSVSVELYKLKY